MIRKKKWWPSDLTIGCCHKEISGVLQRDMPQLWVKVAQPCPGLRRDIAQLTQVPCRLCVSIFNFPLKHWRWPLLETEDKEKIDHWVCSGMIVPMFCSTERVVINKNTANLGHLPVYEQWDCFAGLCSPSYFCCYWNVTLADSSVGSHIWRRCSAGMGETGQIVVGFHIWGQFMPDELLWKMLALHQPRGCLSWLKRLKFSP